MRLKKVGKGLLCKPPLNRMLGHECFLKCIIIFLHPFITLKQGNRSREKVRVGILKCIGELKMMRPIDKAGIYSSIKILCYIWTTDTVKAH